MKKKVVNRVVNIILAVVIVLLLLVTLNVLLSKNKGYTSFFGNASLAVETNSMSGKNKDSFDKGDMIFIKILKDSEKGTLKENDIITFYQIINGKRELNSHRIVTVDKMEDKVFYTTKGDNNINTDDRVESSQVIGKYTGKLAKVGNITLFFSSPTGFMIFVVVPSILLVIYCGFLVFKNLKDKRKDDLVTERDKIREELLKEMSEKQDLPENEDKNEDEK